MILKNLAEALENINQCRAILNQFLATRNDLVDALAEIPDDFRAKVVAEVGDEVAQWLAGGMVAKADAPPVQLTAKLTTRPAPARVYSNRNPRGPVERGTGARSAIKAYLGASPDKTKAEIFKALKGQYETRSADPDAALSAAFYGMVSDGTIVTGTAPNTYRLRSAQAQGASSGNADAGG